MDDSRELEKKPRFALIVLLGPGTRIQIIPVMLNIVISFEINMQMLFHWAYKLDRFINMCV